MVTLVRMALFAGSPVLGGVYLCAYCQLSRAVTSITLLHRSGPGLDTVLYMCHPVGW